MKNVAFYLRPKENSNKPERPIHLRVAIGKNPLTGKYEEYKRSTDLEINPKYWSKKHERATSALPEGAGNFNQVLEDLAARVREAILSLKQKGIQVSKVSLDRELSASQVKESSLLEFLDQYIKDCKEGKITNPRTGLPIVENTYKGYNNLLYRLKIFNDNIRPVTFVCFEKNEAIKFYQDYTHFLRFKFFKYAEKKKIGAVGLAENSIGTDIKNLKMILGQAVKRGITNVTGHMVPEFRVIEEEVDTIALDKSECLKIINADSLPDHLIEEQHRFIIAYNFVLRFKDSIRIEKGNVVKQGKNIFLRKRAEKTNKIVMVPIMKATMKILEIYDFKMPNISNQESNWKLKEIGRILEINTPVTISYKRAGKLVTETKPKYELMSTHTSRRSAATNMWRDKVPVKLIMDMGGWRTEEEFFKYIKVDAEEAAELAAAHPYFNHF